MSFRELKLIRTAVHIYTFYRFIILYGQSYNRKLINKCDMLF